MRQVIRRFLKHFEAEKNASLSTIDSYQYDLNKFDDYVAHRLGNRFLPGDISRDHIRDYLMWLSEVGHQKPNGPFARARALAAIRSFFKYAHRARLLRDNPAAEIPFQKSGWVKSALCPRMNVAGFCELSRRIGVHLKNQRALIHSLNSFSLARCWPLCG
jgi:site-specific recombinase XerD